jgi:hypothetical protein
MQDRAYYGSVRFASIISIVWRWSVNIMKALHRIQTLGLWMALVYFSVEIKTINRF